MLMFRGRAAYSDGEIDLIPVRTYPPEKELGFGRMYDFIIAPCSKRREAGRISLRLGESVGVYYFGHIGYHVDKPYRGHGWAWRACRLLEPLMAQEHKTSVVITCDPDNWASRKTCEHLGCTLERVVDVPESLRSRYEISAVKCRYIWRLDDETRHSNQAWEAKRAWR